MQSEFLKLGFDKYLYAKGRSSLADSFTANNRCGIYILHFEDGEYYVGLAIDVVRRHAQHRKTHSDIEYVSFKEVPKEKLPEIERETVFKLENLKKPLRNISIVSIIIGETDLDLVVSKEDQTKWLNYELAWETLKTERFDYPELRMKYRNKFKKFKNSSLFDTCCKILHDYIYYTVPFPRRTEYSFWSCLCLPTSTDVLVRVNMFWQETLHMYEEEVTYTENGIEKKEIGVGISIWLSKSKLFENNTKQQLEEKYASISFGDVAYAPGGQDQQQVIISDDEFFDFLYDRHISDAIKDFNLRIMRKGGCISNWYHCFDLADEAVRTDNITQV